jgi:hypothetical protein
VPAEALHRRQAIVGIAARNSTTAAGRAQVSRRDQIASQAAAANSATTASASQTV